MSGIQHSNLKQAQTFISFSSYRVKLGTLSVRAPVSKDTTVPEGIRGKDRGVTFTTLDLGVHIRDTSRVRQNSDVWQGSRRWVNREVVAKIFPCD